MKRTIFRKIKIILLLSIFITAVGVQARNPNFRRAKRDTIRYIKKKMKFRVRSIKKDGRSSKGQTSDVRRKYGKYARKNKWVFPFKVVTRKKKGISYILEGNAVYMRRTFRRRSRWKFQYFNVIKKQMKGGKKFTAKQLEKIVINAMNSQERRRTWFGYDAKYIHSISNLQAFPDTVKQEKTNEMEFLVKYTQLKRETEQTIVKRAVCKKIKGKWVIDGRPRPGYSTKYRGSSPIYRRELKSKILDAMPNLKKDGYDKVKNYKFKQ